MISQKLVDHTNIGRAIRRLLELVYAPSAGTRNSVGSTKSFFHTSMVLHPGSDDHLLIRKFIHEGFLSSLSKKQQNEKVSMNNTALGFDYKLSINILMKQLYIVVNTKSEHLTKAIDGDLIDINKLEMNKRTALKVSYQSR